MYFCRMAVEKNTLDNIEIVKNKCGLLNKKHYVDTFFLNHILYFVFIKCKI